MLTQQDTFLQSLVLSIHTHKKSASEKSSSTLVISILRRYLLRKVRTERYCIKNGILLSVQDLDLHTSMIGLYDVVQSHKRKENHLMTWTVPFYHINPDHSDFKLEVCSQSRCSNKQTLVQIPNIQYCLKIQIFTLSLNNDKNKALNKWIYTNFILAFKSTVGNAYDLHLKKNTSDRNG